MYKILVVDDEALERSALRAVIERSFMPNCTVDVAVNGQEAIAKAERMRADIVLMDIEMPGISGLEAARIIKQMLPRCHILMLTAYQHFQYAQEAIEIGADDYLLKPLPDRELLKKMEVAMAEVNKDRNDIARRLQLDQLAKEQFVLSVISGYSNQRSLQGQLLDLGIDFSYGFFMVIRGERTKSAEKLAQMALPLAKLMEKGSLLTYEYDEALLIAAVMQGDYRGVDWMMRTAAAFLSEVERTHHERLLVGIGDAVSSPIELRISYELAQTAIARTGAQSPIAMGAGHPSDTREGLEAQLYHLLLEKDLDSAVQLTDAAMDAWAFSAARPGDAISHIERLLGGVLHRLKEDTRIDSPNTDLSRWIKGDATRMEWSIAIRTLFSDWIREADAQRVPHIQAVKQEIERYLHRHYSEDLSIGKAARDMHYSEAYFSKLFTRCFQRNFLSYLTELRLGMAVEMMANPLVSIREIGIAVGYADSNYFAKVFRKAYGLSPSDFRRKRMARKEAET